MSAFQNYFVNTLKNRYADFSGRASRSEYWYFGLFVSLITIPLIILLLTGIDLSSGSSGALDPSISTLGKISVGLFVLTMLAIIIPSLAVTIRRLHDIGRSGWWYLIAFVPFGSLVLFVFSLLESEPGKNKWGPNPWEVDEDDQISQHLIEDYKL